MNDKVLINKRYISLLATVGLFVLAFGAGSFVFRGFFSMQNFFNLLNDNSFLFIMAAGMTLVIISGGIDLSVGSVLALTTMVTASLIEKQHLDPLIVVPLVLLMGAALGSFMGYLIHTFDLQPFIVTLGGLYLARGLCYIVSIDTISITNQAYLFLSQLKIHVIGKSYIYINIIIGVALLIFAIYLAHYTKFGRTVYAIGGNEQSALLMGLPVKRHKILLYTFSGFCSALAGVVFTFYMGSGYALHGKGMELDTIAAVVIGGTLLTGGVGYIVGTVFGVLIFGTIQYLIMFQGSLNSWWTRIVIGMLIFVFCLLQRFFETSRTRKAVAKSAAPAEAAVKS
jgi:galactofuranose transport system permease protein